MCSEKPLRIKQGITRLPSGMFLRTRYRNDGVLLMPEKPSMACISIVLVARESLQLTLPSNGVHSSQLLGPFASDGIPRLKRHQIGYLLPDSASHSLE